jgi:outer membrane protein OmpA-like peptidoglycan-associated protein
MKKSILPLATLLLFFGFTKAQFFTGLRSSPYGGVTNVGWSPAIADSRFIADVNLIGFGFNAGNNYVGLDRNVYMKKGYIDGDKNFQDTYLKERINGNKKAAFIGMQVQGPLSFMCSWGKGENKNKNAFAFTYNINSIFNADKIDETFARIAYYGAGYKADSILGYLNKGLNNQNISTRTMVWADYGLTYSRVAYDKGDHFIIAGGTLKLLQGISAGYAYVKDLKYKWEDFDTLSIFQTEAKYAYSQGLVSSKGFPTDDITSNAKNLFSFKYSYPSFGADLGVTYQWRPKKDKYKYQMDCKDEWRFDQNRYTLAAGISIIDIGAIRYKKGEYSGNFKADIQDWLVKNAKFPDGLQSIDDTIRTRFTVTDDGKNYFTMALPTRINLFLDYNIAYGFGLNLSGVISPNMAPNRNMVHHNSSITFTPKYDHAWFGAYIPMTYDALGNFSLGTTLRMGPLIVGTQDLLGLFAKKFAYNADIHLALKVTIPYQKKRDRDKDGVSNRKDLCKKDKGTCETQGCPDRDMDGTTDPEDKCPDNPGPKELKGCPDADGDGITDMEDSCVNDKGPLEFHGCPDRDGDKVIDKLDECPDTPGEKEFNGCPDRDKDGTPDKIDLCPDVPGPKDHYGCPDTDGDGVYDNEDKCIQTPGALENLGCPWADKDNDGVFDKDDACPTIPGLPENKGCPKLEKKELETIKYAFENLEFETGKDIIRTSSYPSLNALASLLVKKSNYGLRIEGHTDNVGLDEKNMILSQKRADAVKSYLTRKGVSKTYLETYGYGETKPIATNETKEGKQKNRRVEMTITFH